MAQKAWVLESIAADGSRRVQPVSVLPFRIGRDPSNHLVVDARGLSRQHAVLSLDAAGRLCVSDAGSTNGTYVNRERIVAPWVLSENDVLHFGNAEFRLALQGDGGGVTLPAESEPTLLVPKGQTLTENFVRHEREFMQLLAGQGLSAAVQPIVEAQGGRLYAYELLGRCLHPSLPNSPGQLFHLATMLGREAELSAAFRRHGVPIVAPRLRGARLFVNAHPQETFEESFFQGLAALRAQPTPPEIVVELHETAVLEVARMRELAARLAGIGVPFAYDDFGAGQARLNELGDVPAQYVKFDMGLVHRIHEATERKQRMVRDLVKLVLDLGSVPLAEGVELQAEADVCRDMGFQLVQGWLTGKPVPVELL